LIGAEDDQAVAGGLHIRELVGGAKSGDGMELVGGSDPCTVVQRHDVQVPAAVVGAVALEEEGQRGLAAVVGEEEFTGGGGAAPSAADGAAAEEGLVGKAEEDLPDEDLIRETGVERRRSCSCGLRHGRRLKIF
jgi:hypothetical protein